MNSKSALITGSSRGLGFEIAMAMAVTGFQVVITGRSPDSLASAMDKLRAVSTSDHQSVCLDLVDEGGPGQLHSQLTNLGISPKVIVNNLGGGIPKDRRNLPIDILRASLRLNLEVGIEINNLFYDELKATKGVIVHIGSTASLHFDAPPGYVIGKAAVNAYVKNAARTFARDGVCIFAVLPGMLEHDGSYIDKQHLANPARYGQALCETVYGRFTTSAETARFIVKTIEAGTPMVNGALLQFDGGRE